MVSSSAEIGFELTAGSHRLDDGRAVSRAGFAGAVVGVLLAAVFVCLHWVLGTGIVDDTYIFLRYAENLASGSGPVFNFGERVEGYTSPLWVLMLGAMAVSKLDLVVAAPILSGLFGLATVVLLHREARLRLPTPSVLSAAIPAWFLATNPSLIFWSWSGMETGLVTFLLAGSVLQFLRALDDESRMTRAGIWYLLAVWARPDALAILPALITGVVWVHRSQSRLLRRKLCSFLVPLLLLALQFFWRYAYYGAWLPNTYLAKADLPSALLLHAGLDYAEQFAVAYGFPLALISLYTGWVLYRDRSLPASWGVTVAAGASWLVYVVLVGGDHFALFRFFVPILPLMAFAMILISQDWLATPNRSGIGAWVLGCVFCAVVLSASNVWVYAGNGGKTANIEVELARRWSVVGQWLKANVPTESTIASSVVGAIPYHSGLTTYDLLGLTDRTVAAAGKIHAAAAVGHQRYHTDYILEKRPDYIVVSSSGLFDRPNRPLPPKYAYAMIDLIRDPRTRESYRYRSVRLPSGKYIELYERKKSGNRSEE
ncbi:hypothetical protein MK489_07975 [Myxococcota bacterium]|nr:hypothetical protein [Myxococcota bacterium]